MFSTRSGSHNWQSLRTVPPVLVLSLASRAVVMAETAEMSRKPQGSQREEA